ncbi:MAG: caspase family protein [Myxococcota bacterium]
MIAVAAAWAAPRGVESGVAAPAGLDRAYASRRVALVVGIDTYVDPALGNLRFAAKDATDLASVLRDPSVGGYDAVSVVAGEVTRASFWTAFRALASTVQRDDTVVVYVAGHGTLDLGPGGTELYLLGSDSWLTDAAGGGIRVQELSDAVGALGARRTALVLDTCYSGAGRSVIAPAVKRKLDGLRGPVPAPPALTVSEFAANLYAAHVNQPSIEDPALENGVYTHFLVEALRGAGDVDFDGLVEVMEAHGYARDHTLAYTGGTQVPWAETVSVGREALFLAGDPAERAQAEHALLVGLEGLPAGASVTVDGVSRGGGPLQPGARALEVRDGDRVLLSERVQVRAGERVDLASHLARRDAAWFVVPGVAGSLDPDWLGPVGLSLAVAAAPAYRGGVRPVLGLSATTSRGPGMAAGTAAATGALTAAHGPLELGPSLGLGLAWRLPDDPGPQGSLLLVPGFVARIGAGPIGVQLDAGARVFVADAGWVALPTAGAGISIRR